MASRTHWFSKFSVTIVQFGLLDLRLSSDSLAEWILETKCVGDKNDQHSVVTNNTVTNLDSLKILARLQSNGFAVGPLNQHDLYSPDTEFCDNDVTWYGNYSREIVSESVSICGDVDLETKNVPNMKIWVKMCFFELNMCSIRSSIPDFVSKFQFFHILSSLRKLIFHFLIFYPQLIFSYLTWHFIFQNYPHFL